MQVTLTIIRYPRQYIFFALLAMAVFHLPLWLKKNISFYKLMGSGRNGTFDKNPDWQQWAILAVHQQDLSLNKLDASSQAKRFYGGFIQEWLNFFHCEKYTMVLEAIEGHGYWDKQQPFGLLPKSTSYEGPIGVMTRATIRLSKLRSFWSNVDGVAAQMKSSRGLYSSFGIGEIPFIKQATFSVWQNKEAMKDFAYRMREHNEVIVKTRKEDWYSEEMFVRFKMLLTIGSVNGVDPLNGKL